jgi:hypothetical protein
LNATISVKPTALGLLLDVQHCEQALELLAGTAELYETGVCMDTEDIRCTEPEIRLYTRLKSRHSNVELALQAYLKRTYQDIEPLLAEGSNLRLCKGIYWENSSHLVESALNDRSAINAHFLRHVSRCFEMGTFIGRLAFERLVRWMIELSIGEHFHTENIKYCCGEREIALSFWAVTVSVHAGNIVLRQATRMRKIHP